jgi:hypothetical protein
MGVIIGGLIYLGSRSPSTPNSSNQSVLIPPKRLTSTQTATRSETTGEFKRSLEGFIPSDRCECGGNWVKHVNKVNGGKFFGCSRYPRCKNTRDKQKAKYFCGNGHKRTADNTLHSADGGRRCLICRPLPKQSPSSNYRGTNSGNNPSQPSSYDTNLYCRNGHKRTIENTYVRPNGERECGICRKNARK